MYGSLTAFAFVGTSAHRRAGVASVHEAPAGLSMNAPAATPYLPNRFANRMPKEHRRKDGGMMP
jgi:hypothetical protein